MLSTLRLHVAAALVVACTQAAGDSSAANSSSFGAIQPIVDAFGPETRNGKVMQVLTSKEGDDRWLFRGIPFDMGNRFAELDNPIGSVMVSAWLHEGFPKKGEPRWFGFGVQAKGLSVDATNREERDRKLGQVIKLVADIVPKQVRHNVKRVLDALPCTTEHAKCFTVLVATYGDPNHYSAIIESDPDLRGGPRIGVALGGDWTLEVACQSDIASDQAGVFLWLLDGYNDTQPFAECYSELGKCWEFWPQYNPFGVEADE